MKPSEEQWNRWLDGSLPPEEAEAMEVAAQDDPALAADRAFFGQLSADLKDTFPSERTPPFADFFNSHLQKRIRDLNEEASQASQRPSWWPDWFRLSWMMPLAGAAIVVFTLMQIGLIGGRSGSQIVYAYTPDDTVKAHTDFDRETKAMIVRLDGIDPLPEGFDLLLAANGEAEPKPFLVDATPWSTVEEPPVEPVAQDFVFVGPQIQFITHQPAY